MLSFIFASLAFSPLLFAMIAMSLGEELPETAFLQAIAWGVLAIWAELRRNKGE